MLVLDWCGAWPAVAFHHGLHGVEPSEVRARVRKPPQSSRCMIVHESDVARPRHRGELPHQDPGHRCSLLRYRGVGSCLVRQRNPGRSCRAPTEAPNSSRTCSGTPGSNSRLHRHLNAGSWAKTRPNLKARRREQGSEIRPCLLRLYTTEASLKQKVQLSSAANGPAAHDGAHSSQQRRAGLRTERTATRATRRQARRRGGLLKLRRRAPHHPHL